MNAFHLRDAMYLNKTLSIAGLSFSLVGFANADVESSISAGYNSDYIYRGVNLGADQVSLAIDASGSVAGLDWNVGLFQGSSDIEESSIGIGALLWPGGLDETRITAGVSRGLAEGVDLNVGIINTSYNGILGGTADRLEIYTGLSATIACIDLSATAFFNTTDEYTGDLYYEISASYSVDVADNVSATLGVTYGNWDEDPLGNLEVGPNFETVRELGLGWEDVDFLSLSGALNISLDDNLSASVGVTHVITDAPGLTEDETVIGASLSFGF